MGEGKIIMRGVKVGNYIFGLPTLNKPKENMECDITENDFIFFGPFRFGAVGRIPRDAVNQIFVDNKSQVHQRLGVLRLLAFGPLAFAAPIKKESKNYCLVIDWQDAEGKKYNTVFEAKDEGSAKKISKAANTLNKYLKPKAVHLKPDEQKCPFCAETIKKEAKICRFCSSKLEEDPFPSEDLSVDPGDKNTEDTETVSTQISDTFLTSENLSSTVKNININRKDNPAFTYFIKPLLVLIFFLCLFQLSALFFADTQVKNTKEKVFIDAQALNVRKGPGISNNIIEVLSHGEAVYKTNEKDGWLKITYGNKKTGWISKQYTSATKPKLVEDQKTEPKPPEPAELPKQKLEESVEDAYTGNRWEIAYLRDSLENAYRAAKVENENGFTFTVDAGFHTLGTIKIPDNYNPASINAEAIEFQIDNSELHEKKPQFHRSGKEIDIALDENNIEQMQNGNVLKFRYVLSNGNWSDFIEFPLAGAQETLSSIM